MIPKAARAVKRNPVWVQFPLSHTGFAVLPGQRFCRADARVTNRHMPALYTHGQGSGLGVQLPVRW